VRPSGFGVIEVQVHLSGICVGKFMEFEVNDNQTAQAAMEKDQVDAKNDAASGMPRQHAQKILMATYVVVKENRLHRLVYRAGCERVKCPRIIGSREGEDSKFSSTIESKW
jgi:hypothetical protein